MQYPELQIILLLLAIWLTFFEPRALVSWLGDGASRSPKLILLSKSLAWGLLLLSMALGVIELILERDLFFGIFFSAALLVSAIDFAIRKELKRRGLVVDRS